MTASQTYVSWLTLYLATKLTPAWTLLVTADPWITQWRLFLKNNYQTEWIEFTSVSSSWSNYELWGLTRDINPVTIPATSASTGKTWLATQACILTAMHDQIIDRNVAQQIHQEALTFATTTARDTALWGNWVCTFNYTDIKVTATGLFYNYNTTSGQWEVQWTWTATPNASTTVSWSVEIATSAESKAWTDTWGTWALLSVLPSDIAKNIQSWTFLYWVDVGANDTYVISLTPTLTAYTTWQTISFKPNTVNTWACTINIDWLWAKSIKSISWADLVSWDLKSWKIYTLKYNWTDFIVQTPIHTYVWDGSDGVQWDSNLTITWSNNTVITKNFTSWTAWSVARTCTITPTNCITHIKIKWDADFTNWTFDFAWKWASWWSAVTSWWNAVWIAWTNSTLLYGWAVNWGGSWGLINQWGGWWSGYASNWSNGGAWALWWTKSTDISLPYFQNQKRIWVTTGAGGWSGWVQNGTSWAGGAGGGALIIEVGWNVIFSSTTITVAWANWTNAPSFWAGGWWGGWVCIILYTWDISWTVTPTVSWWIWGNWTWINWAGGAGGDGVYYIQKNVTWY